MPSHLVGAVSALSAIWVAGIVGAVGATADADTPALTLEQCVELAYAAPSDVSIAREQREAADAGLKAAWGGFLPHASLDGGYTYNRPLRDDHDTQSFASLDGIDHYVAVGDLTAELDTSGRLRAGLRQARAERDAATAAHQLSRRELRLEVSRAYFAALLARKLVAVARDSLDEAKWFEDRARRLTEHGEAARVDVVQASAQVAELGQRLQDAELNASLSQQELASFWTPDVSAPLALADVLDGPEPEAPPELEPDAAWMDARPQSALLDARRRALLAEARGARAQRLPQADVSFRYGLDAVRKEIDDRGYAVFVHLNVPLFDGWKASSAAHQLEVRARQVAARQQIQMRQLAKRYEGARERVVSLRGQVANARTRVDLLDDALRLSRVRYDGGEATALEVLNAQAQLAAARADLYRTKAAAWQAAEDLRAVTGPEERVE